MKWSDDAIDAAINCWYPGGVWKDEIGHTINKDIYKITREALNAAAFTDNIIPSDLLRDKSLIEEVDRLRAENGKLREELAAINIQLKIAGLAI